MKTNRIKKVVLIDDDKIFNLIHELIVKETGLVDNIETFDIPEIAITYLEGVAQAHPEAFPDIILLDLSMPVMDGWECLKRFTQFPNVFRTSRIMILSSSVAESDRIRSRDYAMVSGFMSKPLDREKIHTYLQEHASQEA